MVEICKEEISRYSRQLILDQVQLKGQRRLKESSVLIVGAGGLGSPVGLYLASAGVGRLGFVDYDSVEISNLHRQIIHREDKVNVLKAESAKEAVLKLNSNCVCETFNIKISSENALDIVRNFDIVVDASDNVATRYLINDACVLSGKVLVSGSALRFNGQLVIYNYNGGPCYRCLFPSPPPPETVTNCSDGGVMGPICGVIGSLQAMEVLKILMEEPTGKFYYLYSHYSNYS